VKAAVDKNRWKQGQGIELQKQSEADLTIFLEETEQQKNQTTGLSAKLQLETMEKIASKCVLRPVFFNYNEIPGLCYFANIKVIRV